MKKRNKAIICALALAMLIMAAGCANVPSEAAQTPTPSPAKTAAPSASAQPAPQPEGDDTSFQEAVTTIIADRLAALETQDYDLYMSAIGLNNQFYYNEQERWFMNMIAPSISQIQFEVLSTEMLDENTGVANIRQQHRMDQTYDFEYPLLFKLEDGEWMDYGYAFEEYETERFTVKYMKDETKRDDFVQMLDDAFDYLDTLYPLKPFDDYEMKLFSDQEMLRQRCIPANPWLFTGWSEPDESLKIFTGQPYGYDSYAGVVQHELVHHITIRMCNNNLPVWILEGIAMYDGSAYYGVENSKMLSSMTKDRVSQTIADLEKNDLSTNLTTQGIYNYYSTSYMYVRYIVETYGRDKLMGIFLEAGKKPFHDSTLNDMFEINNRKTAGEVIPAVLGLTKEELSAEYLAWLEGFNFDNIAHTAAQMNGKLAPAMILVGEQFGDTYFTMKEALQRQGFRVVTVGDGAKEMYSSCSNYDSIKITPEMMTENITAENIGDFSLLFIPAGRHHRSMRSSDEAERLLNLCKENDVYISSVCVGNVVLAAFDGIVDGHEVAASSHTESVIKSAGGICKFNRVVADGFLVTGNTGNGYPHSAPVEKMAQTLKELIDAA